MASSRGPKRIAVPRLPTAFVHVDLADAEERRQQHRIHRHAWPVERPAMLQPGVGQEAQAPITRAAAMGMLIRNSQCQVAISSTTPPMIGPIRNASPNTAPIMPRAPPPLFGRERVADDRAGDGEDTAGAEALDRTAHQQHCERGGQRHDQRAGGEQHHVQHVDAAPAKGRSDSLAMKRVPTRVLQRADREHPTDRALVDAAKSAG